MITKRLSHLAKWSLWLNDSVFLPKRSSCGFKSRRLHLLISDITSVSVKELLDIQAINECRIHSIFCCSYYNYSCYNLTNTIFFFFNAFTYGTYNLFCLFYLQMLLVTIILRQWISLAACGSVQLSSTYLLIVFFCLADLLHQVTSFLLISHLSVPSVIFKAAFLLLLS